MVEWKKLGEVCDVLNGFAFKSKEYVPTGIRVIRISDVQSGYISDKDLVFYPVEKLSEYKRYLLKRGDLVMSLTGNPGRVACIQEERCALNQRVACLRAKGTSNSYLYYLFNCKEFEAVAFANSTGGAQKNLSTTWLNNYLIPIPSLEEQKRIVGILDTFTDSIENLKQQIAQRRKQYEFYRDQLLDLEGKEGVEMKTLKELFETRNGYTPSTNNNQFWDDGTIPWFKMEDIRDNGRVLSDSNLHITPLAVKGKGLFKANSIILATSATIGEHALITVEHLSNQRFTNFYPKKDYVANINMKFYYYYMFVVDAWCKQHIKQGNFASVDMNGLYNLPIPLPPLSEQSRIVSILDTFEASISNLEAQLEQRQKQYEYYRNQLLTFE